MKKFLLSTAILFSLTSVHAQCDSAFATGLTLQCTGGTSNRGAVAYNPIMMTYYSADAGSSSYPLETFSSAGVPDTSATAGIDFRGLWWNGNTNVVNGNAYSSPTIDSAVLNPANGYAKGAVTTSLTIGMTFTQNCGKYDPDSNEIIFYNSGSIYRFNGTTGALKYTLPITGVATANLNPQFIGYTGMAATPYVVYDYSAQALYFLDRNAAYVKESFLPSGAISRSWFGASYSNGLFWLFDAGSNKWIAYQLSRTTTATIAQSGCDSVVSPSGKYVWKTTGTYMDTIPNKEGCDSIMTVNATVNPLPTVTITGKDTINKGSVDTLTASGGSSYVWTSGSSSDTTMVTPDSTQTYVVTATDTNGCSNKASFTVVVNLTTSLAAVSNSATTVLYPNPATNTINLEFKAPAATQGKIEVCDASGKVISTTVQKLSNGKTVQVDISGLAQGMYFVKVVTAKNTRVIKFIKE